MSFTSGRTVNRSSTPVDAISDEKIRELLELEEEGPLGSAKDEYDPD